MLLGRGAVVEPTAVIEQTRSQQHVLKDGWREDRWREVRQEHALLSTLLKTAIAVKLEEQKATNAGDQTPPGTTSKQLRFDRSVREVYSDGRTDGRPEIC